MRRGNIKSIEITFESNKLNRTTRRLAFYTNRNQVEVNCFRLRRPIGFRVIIVRADVCGRMTIYIHKYFFFFKNVYGKRFTTCAAYC